MKLKLISILLVCFMTSSVFASYFWLQADPAYTASDNWIDPNQWDTAQDSPPSENPGMPTPPNPAGGEVKMINGSWMSGTAHCTVNTNVGNYTGVNISVNGTLYIYSGTNIGFKRSSSVTGKNGLRVGSNTAGGAAPYTGTVNQSAGTVGATMVYLGYAGSNGDLSASGNYIISGGTLTCSSGLAVGTGINGSGAQTTAGKFTVDSSAGGVPAISVAALRVGGTDFTSGTNSGTLEFKIGASGVSPINCTSVNLDAGGANATTTLLVSLTGTAPVGDILLVKSTSAAVVGLFDTVNGVAAAEGAVVFLGSNAYSLTYMYDSVSKAVGSARSTTYNDIALIPSMTISKPPDTNTGDLLIAAVATDGDTSATIAAPSGWTLINRGANSSAVTLAAWWKLAGASEPANHTFSWSGTNRQQAYGWMMRFTGHDSANPINISSTADQTSSTPTSPAVTTTVSNCIILRLGAFDDNSITVSNPGLSDPCHTAITMSESGGSAGGKVSGGAGYVSQATAGLSSGTPTFSLGSAKAARMITIAIAPNGNTSGESEIKP